MTTEAKARILINNLLQEAGWRLIDTSEGKANVLFESHATGTNAENKDVGDDFENSYKGFIDYLLLDPNGFPLCVLEAKSEKKNPLDGKEQARQYAKTQKSRFIILSNGNIHYFWDLECGNPTVISSFPTQESISHFKEFKPNPNKLVDEKISSDYIVQTQLPEYHLDPRWNDERQRSDFIDERNLRVLREYQIRAIEALQGEAKSGKQRFLFEMATGTGKTLVSAAVIKLFLKTGNATRVLFLVDRLELEDQAYKSFVQYLKNDYTTVIYKQKRNDWHKAEIVVSTVQSLTANNKYKTIFSPTDFDLVISDEAHRSISGNSRALFEHFVGYKLGLTATPKDYLKNIDTEKLNPKDIRSWERRQLLDTYTTFGCGSGDPTYRYSLVDGVKEGFLINPIVLDARTEITTQLLSDEGYAVMVDTEDGKQEEQIFYIKDFEKKFFSDRTNRIFCKTFLENALKDPLNGEIGKTIIFCVSQKHASEITKILNEMAFDLWADKYNSDFAMQVTSFIPQSQQFTVNFANNNLGGHSRFLDGYKTSKARVCVTVGMMTTGYDCQDILNLCLMRPIFSPGDFVQIKGRGTRKYTFKHKDGNEEFVQDKKNFKLFDFFAVCEYFEEKYDYDQVISLPPIEGGTGGIGGGGTREVINVVKPDPIKTIVESVIGIMGMRIDREFFDKFAATVKEDPVLKELNDAENIDAMEEYIIENVLDKPKEYFTIDKLRRSVNADRRISLREFIERVFGRIAGFKTKNQLLDEEFEKFIVINKPDSQYVVPARNYFKAYVTSDQFREIINKKDFTQLYHNPGFQMSEFQKLNGWRDIIPEYVKDYVSLNQFM